MRYLRGAIRLPIVIVVIIGIGIPLLALLKWLPYKRHGIPFKAWYLSFLAKTALRVCDIRVECEDRDAFYKHKGFVFTNHTSYLDIIVKVAIVPMRFLAKQEVRKMPMIGWAAEQIGCIFVRRDNKTSRKAARHSLADVDFSIPLVLYPEGTVNRLDSGETLKPFRVGAFEVAAQNSIPYLPATITYDPPEIGRLVSGETNMDAAWRMVTRSGKLVVTVTPHPVIAATPDADPSALATMTADVIRTEVEQQSARMLQPIP